MAVQTRNDTQISGAAVALFFVFLLAGAGTAAVIGNRIPVFAGALIGPWGLRLVSETAATQSLAELGVVLMLFVIGLELDFPRFDLSLERRRETANAVVHEAAAAIRTHGLGLKAATVTPEGRGDIGSPNRILREEIGGRVIVRTGRRIPGVVPVGGVHAPISIVRMAVGDAYGAKEWREGEGDEDGDEGQHAGDEGITEAGLQDSFHGGSFQRASALPLPLWSSSSISARNS